MMRQDKIYRIVKRTYFCVTGADDCNKTKRIKYEHSIQENKISEHSDILRENANITHFLLQSELPE